MGKEILAQVPPEVKDRVTPFLESHQVFREIMRLPEDPPHKRPHVIEALICLSWLWEMLGVVGEFDTLAWDLSDRILRLHDKGYILVEQGIIKPEEHHWGSLLIASVVDPDPRVLYGILHHVDDILPEDAPYAVRVARDLDRVVGLGYTGVVRLAYYLGFNHPFLNPGNETELIKQRILCETYYPDTEGYEEPAKEFFQTEILPFFQSQKAGDLEKIWQMIQQSQVLKARVLGAPRLGIEPVLKPIRELYSPKIKHTLEIEAELLGRSPDGAPDSYSWGRYRAPKTELK